MSTSDQPAFQALPAARPKSGLAIASLVLGILGWTLLPGLGGLIAVITGHLAKSDIRQSSGQLAGNGMATAGLILGYTSTVLGLLLCALVFLSPVFLWFYGDRILFAP